MYIEYRMICYVVFQSAITFSRVFHFSEQIPERQMGRLTRELLRSANDPQLLFREAATTYWSIVNLNVNYDQLRQLFSNCDLQIGIRKRDVARECEEAGKATDLFLCINPDNICKFIWNLDLSVLSSFRSVAMFGILTEHAAYEICIHVYDLSQ